MAYFFIVFYNSAEHTYVNCLLTMLINLPDFFG